MKTDIMTVQLYSNISGKRDIIREVVMKYIDYFYPDASTASAVAIDNKIEQAMDLVKSHLMIAVREEVEVLKEKISELMDKINQLEVENKILKAHMPQETLHRLQLQTQLQITSGVGTTNMIAAPPTLQIQQTQQQQQLQQQQLQQQYIQQQQATQQQQQPQYIPQQPPQQQQPQYIPQQPQQVIMQQQVPQGFIPANTTSGPMS